MNQLKDARQHWDARFAGADYRFGTAPNRFLEPHPPQAENMYTRELLESAFARMDILHLAEYDAVIEEGAGHKGMSALIDLTARKRG